MGFHRDLTGDDIHETVITELNGSPIVLNTVASKAGVLAADISNPDSPVLYKAKSTTAGDWVKFAAAAGGGSGGEWRAGTSSPAPSRTTEFDQDVWEFAGGGGQSLFRLIKVPKGYDVGKPISMAVDLYTPTNDGSSTIRLQAKATLIRKNTDAADDTTNQHTSVNAVITLDLVANKMWQAVLDLTDNSGEINGVAVNPEDQLKLELFRDPSDTDTADLRFVGDSTEFRFQ